MDQDLAATLTPEELEAINGSDVEEGDLDALKAVAGDAADANENDDDDDDGDDDSGNGQPVEGAGAKPDNTDADTAANAAADEGADTKASAKAEEPKPFVPKYEARLPENFEQTILDLKTAEDELKQKFRDGDIEFDEFELERDKILQQRESLNSAKIKAEISQEMSQQTAQQQWQNTVNTFLNSVKSEVDYLANEDLASDLDLFVKQLANNPKNADQSMTWFLEQADRRVRALHNLASGKPTESKQDEKKPDPKDRKPNLGGVPKNLSQVPGGDGPGDVGGEFAHLDSLEGEDLEAAIAKMTPAQREKFARS